MGQSTLFAEPFADTTLLRFPNLARLPGLAHVITTKPWNMAPHRELAIAERPRQPNRETVLTRRRCLCEHMGLSFDRLTAPDQIHSAHVLRVAPEDVGRGRLGRETAVRFVDGLVCDIPDTPIIQLSGDCPLVLAYDPHRRAFGTAHASWRGTVGSMAARLIGRMVVEFGCSPDTIHAAIAPCAGGDAYEVGEEVRRVARAMLPDADQCFLTRDGRIMFDLKAANAGQLRAAGIPDDQIEIAAECTITDDRFYSHRREGPSTGRFALIAGLK